MNMMEKFVSELNESDPDKRNHFLQATLQLFQVSIEALKESPEFRQKFLEIHAEFLKYPESKDMIKESIIAYEKYKNDNYYAH